MGNEKGYTLIEVIVSILIASLLMTAIITFYVQARKAEVHGEQALDSLQDTQTLLGYLLDDLQALAPEPDDEADEWVVFEDVDADERMELVFYRFSDLDAETGEVQRRRVEYEVNPGGVDNPKGPEDYYLRRRLGSGSREEWRLARGGLRDFSARTYWSYWTYEKGLRVFRLASAVPPRGDDEVERFFVRVSFVVQQFNRTGEPTTTLPVTVNVFPRELNMRLHQRWYDDAGDA